MDREASISQPLPACERRRNRSRTLRVSGVDFAARSPACKKSVDIAVALLRVIRDAATSGNSGNIRKRCSTGLCRDTKAEVAATTWTKKTAAATARQKRRRNASGGVNRSPRTNPQENPSRCSEPVGGTDKGWLAEEVENLPPSIVAPGNRRSPTVRPSRS